MMRKRLIQVDLRNGDISVFDELVEYSQPWVNQQMEANRRLALNPVMAEYLMKHLAGL